MPTDITPALALPRIRQAVLAAWDLDEVAGRLQSELGLGAPFSDPGVEYFGLRNAVFALRDTFLEVVSPTREDTAAGRLLERRGGDCGYMVMFQVENLAACRQSAAAWRVREAFEVELEDISEVHLHPADIRGAIVSLSTPRPTESWRWAGPGWRERSAPLDVVGVELALRDPGDAQNRWEQVLGVPAHEAGVKFVSDETDRGLHEVVLDAPDGDQREPFQVGGVSFRFRRASG